MKASTDKNYQCADFKIFYDQNLRLIYESLEPERRKYLRRFFIRFTLFMLIVAIFGLFCYLGIIDKKLLTSKGFVKCMGVAFLCGVVYVAMPFSDYREETKNKVMDIILSFWGNFEYFLFRNLIECKYIEKSELFSSFNKLTTDDAFCGTYHNTKITVAEQSIQIEGPKFEQNIFKGVLILLDFKKRFNGKTVVKAKGRALGFLGDNLFILSYFGAIFAAIFLIAAFTAGKEACFILLMVFGFAILIGGVIIFLKKLLIGTTTSSQNKKNSKNATEPVVLEGIDFIKKWNVFASDQISARIVLTPVLMENMLRIQKLFHGRHIDFCFFNNKLLIAIHTRKNMFETTSLLTPALDYAKVDEVYKQLCCIFKLIDIISAKDQDQL